MIQLMNAMMCVTAAIVMSSTALAAGEVILNRFEAGASSLFQDSKYSVSALVRYAPQYRIDDQFAVGVSADFSRHKFDDDTHFNAMNLLIDGSYALSSDWILGVSAGTELRDCTGCKSETVAGLSAHRKTSYEWLGLKGRSLFAQVLSVATQPTTTGLIVGTQFQF
ncbi:MAG: hypothetical protein KF865_04970 [Bdellovibrionaceae bacterium]|nr:hypothetical protein [Pseudobdellovibrionaceae bacterium]